jgi:hypothetical protein
MDRSYLDLCSVSAFAAGDQVGPKPLVVTLRSSNHILPDLLSISTRGRAGVRNRRREALLKSLSARLSPEGTHAKSLSKALP